MATEPLARPRAASSPAPPTVQLVPAHDLPLAEQAAVFTAAFDGYIGGSFAMDSAALARFICAQGADLCYSRFVQFNGELAGFGYISRTGNISRLAAMGVLLEARRHGVARQLLRHLVEEAKERHDEAIVLEVIEQHRPAHALYRSNGFREVTRLLGWRRAPDAVTPPGKALLEQISLGDACHKVATANNFPALPWQVSPNGVAKLAAARAFRAGNATIVIGAPESPEIRVHAIFSSACGDQRWADMRLALSAVLTRYPGSEFFTPPVFPQEFGRNVFQPLGFALYPINQVLMHHICVGDSVNEVGTS